MIYYKKRKGNMIMIGKVDAYITLKKNNTSIEVELDTPQ